MASAFLNNLVGYSALGLPIIAAIIFSILAIKKRKLYWVLAVLSVIIFFIIVSRIFVQAY